MDASHSKAQFEAAATFAGAPNCPLKSDSSRLAELIAAYLAAQAAYRAAVREENCDTLQPAYNATAQALVEGFEQLHNPFAVPDDLDHLISAVEIANLVDNASCVFEDAAALGRKPDSYDDHLRKIGHDALDSAVSAFVAHPVRTASELVAYIHRALALVKRCPAGLSEDALIGLIETKNAEVIEGAVDCGVSGNEDDDFDVKELADRLNALGCKVTRKAIYTDGCVDEAAGEVGLNLIGALPAHQRFQLRVFCERPDWNIISRARIDAADDPQWRELLLAFEAAYRDWDVASDVEAEADLNSHSAEQLELIKSENSRTCAARRAAEAAIWAYPVRTARSLADKAGLYYALRQQTRMEDIWLDARQIALGYMHEEPKSESDEAMVARLFLDAERLAGSGSDAELLKLGEERLRLFEAMAAAEKVYEHQSKILEKTAPPKPDALRRRSDDWASLGLQIGGAGEWIETWEMDKVREFHAHNVAANESCGVNKRYRERGQNVIDAFDEWYPRYQAQHAALGLEQAGQACDDADHAISEVTDKIRAMRAYTRAGLQLKALIVQDCSYKRASGEVGVGRETLRSLLDDLLTVEA